MSQELSRLPASCRLSTRRLLKSALAVAVAIGLPCLSTGELAGRAWAANPPTNYTLQTTPYNGSEQWYCEDVTHVADKACNVTGLFTSVTTLSNLNSATALTQIGVITAGGLGVGATVNASGVVWSGTVPQANLSSCYNSGIVPISCGGNGTASPGIQVGAGLTKTGSWPTQTITASVGASQNFQPGNPTQIASTSALMFGLNMTVTPSKSGTVLLSISGILTTGNGACEIALRYGTGTAPTNQAAASGTVLTGNGTPSNNISYPFTLTAVVSGLTLSTAYWFDVSGQTNAGSTSVSISNINGVAMEQ